MRGWLSSNKERHKTKQSIVRFITGWLSREQDRGRGSKMESSRDKVKTASDYEDGDDFFA